MSKQSQHVLIALPHPLLHLVSLGLVSFIFTLFSLELSQFGTQLAPLWFPTSIMMVAFYRHAGRMWPGIALSCSLGNIAASILLFSTSSLNMTWTTINIVEAVVGAVLLRKLLPWYNPLQNLADWLRLALGSAIVPPLLGGGSGCPADGRRRSSQGIFDMGTVRIHRRTGTGAAGVVI